MFFWIQGILSDANAEREKKESPTYAKASTDRARLRQGASTHRVHLRQGFDGQSEEQSESEDNSRLSAYLFVTPRQDTL